MNVDSAAAYLADSIEGAASRGNIVEIPPAPPRMFPGSLKKSGLPTDWCNSRATTPEEKHLLQLSQKLRRDLKKAYKKGEPK